MPLCSWNSIWPCSPEPGDRRCTLVVNTEHCVRVNTWNKLQTTDFFPGEARWKLQQNLFCASSASKKEWTQDVVPTVISYSTSVCFLSFSVSKTKVFQWCWVSLGNLPLHHCRWDWQAVFPRVSKLCVSGLPVCSSWSELPVLCIESAKSLANGSSEPCLLEKAPALGLERWFRQLKTAPSLLPEPKVCEGGVSIGLILWMLDGPMYHTTEMWSHSSARRS